MVQEDSPYAKNVNLDKVMEYIDENLRTVGLSDAIVTTKEGGDSADKEAAQVDDEEGTEE
jgi:hypothetical protein